MGKRCSLVKILMHILVVGFGYLGGRIALHLSKNPFYKVTVATREPSKYSLIFPDLIFVAIDWSDDQSLFSVTAGKQLIIHTAGMNSFDCASDPAAALSFNGVCTTRLIQAAIKNSVTRFIYFSTAHVYCSPLTGSLSESSCALNLHPYATSHLSGEHSVLNASKLGLIQGIVFRLSNSFGSPITYDMNCWNLLVNDLCRQAVLTGRMTLNNPSLDLRDFVPLTSVCFIVEQFSNFSLLPFVDGIYNLGSGTTMSIYEMASLLNSRCSKLLGDLPLISPSEPDTSYSFIPNSPTPLSYNIDKLKSLVGDFDLPIVEEIDSLILFLLTQLRDHSV